MHTTSGGARPRVTIIGGTGYGGAELIRLLRWHPGVELVRVTSIDQVGEPLEAVHRNLPKTGLVFENIPAAEAAKDVDVVFLALPHKVSATMGAELAGVEARVIDLSGDFRLRSKDEYKTFYGDVHPHPEFLGTWVYGLPELNKAAIREARRVASPGCFATTIALGLLPLAHAGLLKGPLHTVAMTGSSGSGAYAQIGTHHPLRAGNLKTYKVLNHQHTPEIEHFAAGQSYRYGNPRPLLHCFPDFHGGISQLGAAETSQFKEGFIHGVYFYIFFPHQFTEGLHYAHAQVAIEVIVTGENGHFVFFDDFPVLVIGCSHSHAQFLGFITAGNNTAVVVAEHHHGLVHQ